jgi:hypothetical protein
MGRTHVRRSERREAKRRDTEFIKAALEFVNPQGAFFHNLAPLKSKIIHEASLLSFPIVRIFLNLSLDVSGLPIFSRSIR